MLTYKARRDTWYDCSVLLVCLMDERSALTVPTMLGLDPCQTLHNRQPRAFPVALDTVRHGRFSGSFQLPYRSCEGFQTRSQPSDNGGGRFSQMLAFLGFDWISQWLSRGNLEF